jgi:RNA polymerase sigma-70 factor, ECF subfamily
MPASPRFARVSSCGVSLTERPSFGRVPARLDSAPPHPVAHSGQNFKEIRGMSPSLSLKVCGHGEDAEDTMQEVVVKALPYLPKFESPRALLVWLYKVAKNRCLMSRRKSKFVPKQDLPLEELMPDRQELAQLSKEGPVNPETLAIRSQQAKRLREVIQELPPEYRIVLVLRDMEGLTDEEGETSRDFGPVTRACVCIGRDYLFGRNWRATGRRRALDNLLISH